MNCSNNNYSILNTSQNSYENITKNIGGETNIKTSGETSVENSGETSVETPNLTKKIIKITKKTLSDNNKSSKITNPYIKEKNETTNTTNPSNSTNISTNTFKKKVIISKKSTSNNSKESKKTTNKSPTKKTITKKSATKKPKKTSKGRKKEKPIVTITKVEPDDLPKDTWVVGSFDIGIKNLAYCVMSMDKKKPSGSQYPIYDWGVINLIPDDIQLYCQVKYKTGQKKDEICGRKASYYYDPQDIKLIIPNNNSNNTSLNNDHSKDHSNDHSNNQSKDNNNDQSNEQCKDEKEKDTRIGYCKGHMSKCPDPSRLVRHKKVDNMTNQELNLEVIKELDKYPIFLECDEILLEHQPSKNPRMKNLSYMIFSYFTLRGLVDNGGKARLKNIKFINPKRKLSIYEGPAIPCHLKSSYSQNKFYGKEYCKYEIRLDQEKLDYFNNFSKKDDLADSMLQGAWYLKKNK